MLPYRRVSIPRSLDQFKRVNSKIWKVKSAGTLQIYWDISQQFSRFTKPMTHSITVQVCWALVGDAFSTAGIPPSKGPTCNLQLHAITIIRILYNIYINVYTHMCISSCLLYIYSSVNIAFASPVPHNTGYAIQPLFAKPHWNLEIG